MKSKLNLTAEKILKNKFKVEFGGYSSTEVDNFLDEIIDDYKLFEETQKLQEEKILELKKNEKNKNDIIINLKLKITTLENMINNNDSKKQKDTDVKSKDLKKTSTKIIKANR